MSSGKLTRAIKALEKAYREFEESTKKTAAARKAWQEASQRVFGAAPGAERNAASKAADRAEDVFHGAEADERDKRRKYDDALARLVEEALRAAASLGR